MTDRFKVGLGATWKVQVGDQMVTRGDRIEVTLDQERVVASATLTCGTIDDVWVEKAYRRKGLGTLLYVAAAAEMVRRGHQLISPDEYTSSGYSLMLSIAEEFNLEPRRNDVLPQWTFGWNIDWEQETTNRVRRLNEDHGSNSMQRLRQGSAREDVTVPTI